jgi:hypothetical protein
VRTSPGYLRISGSESGRALPATFGTPTTYLQSA